MFAAAVLFVVQAGLDCHSPAAVLPATLPPVPRQTFIDAPNAASGPIPDDVAPFFSGPYFEW